MNLDFLKSSNLRGNLTVTGNASATGTVYASQIIAPISLSTVQLTSITLSQNEQSDLLLINNSLSSFVFVPNDSTTNFNNGAQINITRLGTGTVTITGQSSVFVRSADNKINLRTRYSTATVIKLSANDWLLFGDIV
jgi:hypothetical protein